MAYKQKYTNSSFPFKSPLKDKTPLGPSGGNNEDLLKKYGWSGKTREEVKATIEVDLEDDKEKFVFKVDWDRRGNSDIELISGNVDNVDVDEEDMKMFIMENR